MSFLSELKRKREALARVGQELKETTVHIYVEPWGQSLMSDCPFCGGHHFHGIAPGELEFGVMRPRVADCFKGEYYGEIID